MNCYFISELEKIAASRAMKDALKFLRSKGVSQKNLKGISPKDTYSYLLRYDAPNDLIKEIELEKKVRGGPSQRLLRQGSASPLEYAQYQRAAKRYFSGAHAPKKGETFILLKKKSKFLLSIDECIDQYLSLFLIFRIIGK